VTRQLLWKCSAPTPDGAHKLDSRAIGALGQSAMRTRAWAHFSRSAKADFRQRPSADMPAFYPWWTERKFE